MNAHLVEYLTIIKTWPLANTLSKISTLSLLQMVQIFQINFFAWILANSLVFGQVTDAELNVLIRNMRNESCLTSTYSIKALNYVSDLITPVLSDIINASLNRGIFPDSLKVERDVPLPKNVQPLMSVILGLFKFYLCRAKFKNVLYLKEFLGFLRNIIYLAAGNMASEGVCQYRWLQLFAETFFLYCHLFMPFM